MAKHRIVVVLPSDGNRNTKIQAYCRKLKEKIANQPECDLIWLEYTGLQNINAEIRKVQADLLITVDLAGFEQSTLTDNVAYNLLDCRQIHVILNELGEREQYLSKQLSIAMSFYCDDEVYMETLREKYPDIPELGMLQDVGDICSVFKT